MEVGAVAALVAFLVGLAAIPIVIMLGPRLARPAGRVPGFGTRTEGSPYPPGELADLLLCFEREWCARVRKSDAEAIRAAIDALDIHFIDAVTFNVRGLDVTGVTDRPDLVRVACRGRDSVRRTALGHELIHVALWVTTGEPDPDHAQKRFPGWGKLHDEIEQALR